MSSKEDDKKEAKSHTKIKAKGDHAKTKVAGHVHKTSSHASKHKSSAKMHSIKTNLSAKTKSSMKAKSSLKGKSSIKTKSSVKTKERNGSVKVKSSLKTKSGAKSSIKSSLPSDMVGKKIKMMKTKKKKMPTMNETKSKQPNAKERSFPIGEIVEEKPFLDPPKEETKGIKDDEQEISENEKVVIEVTKEHLEKDTESKKVKDSDEHEKEKKAEDSRNKESENGNVQRVEESHNKEEPEKVKAIEVQPEQEKDKESPKAEAYSPEQKVSLSNDTADVEDNEWEYYWEEVEISGKKEYEPVDEHDLYKYNPNDILRVDLPVNKSSLNVAKEKNESNNDSIQVQGPLGTLVTSEVSSPHEQTPGTELADKQKPPKEKSPENVLTASNASPPRDSAPPSLAEPAPKALLPVSKPHSPSAKQDQKPQS